MLHQKNKYNISDEMGISFLLIYVLKIYHCNKRCLVMESKIFPLWDYCEHVILNCPILNFLINFVCSCLLTTIQYVISYFYSLLSNVVIWAWTLDTMLQSKLNNMNMWWNTRFFVTYCWQKSFCSSHLDDPSVYSDYIQSKGGKLVFYQIISSKLK